MPSFPVELLTEIASGVSSEHDLLQLRAASKTLDNIVSPDVFRKLRVTGTIKSAKGLLNLLNSPNIVIYVQEIEFVEDVSSPAGRVAEELHDGSANESGTDDVAEQEQLDPAETTPTLAQAFALLHQVPSLHTLTFKFSSNSKEENTWSEEEHKPSDSLLMHWAMLGAIANNPHPLLALRTLTLENLVPFQNTLYTTPHLSAIISSLHHLRLNVLADTGMEGAYHQEPLQTFWAQAQTCLLDPAHELRTLHLESNINLGMMPAINFTRLTYPHLEALELIKVHFDGLGNVPAPDSAEVFITRHSKSLKKLTLHECMIYYEEEDAPARLWSTVWNLFAEELQVLVELDVHFSLDQYSQRRNLEERYSRLDAGFGYMSADEDIEGEEEDHAALEAFKAMVASRA